MIDLFRCDKVRCNLEIDPAPLINGVTQPLGQEAVVTPFPVTFTTLQSDMTFRPACQTRLETSEEE